MIRRPNTTGATAGLALSLIAYSWLPPSNNVQFLAKNQSPTGANYYFGDVKGSKLTIHDGKNDGEFHTPDGWVAVTHNGKLSFNTAPNIADKQRQQVQGLLTAYLPLSPCDR